MIIKFLKTRRNWWWVIGTLIALAGVGVVRLIVPQYPPGKMQLMLAWLGYTLVIVGLFSLTLATRKDDK